MSHPAPDNRAEPYLSVVVTTRNDTHGGDPLKRLQLLVNSFDEQCCRNELDAELIVVEWNPPPDKPRVSTLLRLPEPLYCTYRFIEASAQLHGTLQHADVLPLFQMIAKNAGIRRARGRFVLATNIDIIFSDELIEFIAAGRLERGRLYRVDRHDIQSDVPTGASLPELIDYCRSHQLRVHRRWGSYAVDAQGRPASEAHDIVDGRTVRLGRGWHVREGGDSMPYRWASDRAELIVEPPAGQVAGAATVLVLLVESNPYDAKSWVEIEATEGTRILKQARVAGRVRLVIPLENAGGETPVQLRAVDWEQDLRRSLPPFERRDALHYRVLSAHLRSSQPNEAFFQYPLAGWSNANTASELRLTTTSDGVAVETDPRKWSYAVEYGPLWAPRDGHHQFELTLSITEGGTCVTLLDAARKKWIPAFVASRVVSDTHKFDVAADLREGQQFWIVISNDHPLGDGVSRFVVRELKGSVDPGTAALRRAGSPRAGSHSAARNKTPNRRQPWVSKLLDRIAERIAWAVGGRIRYRIMRAVPEFQEMERALRASDERLREAAPLQYLSGLNAFLSEHRPENLHLNGCGDFQLMAREHWEELRAYPEFETFSMNIDGVLSVVADAAGIKEQLLDMPIYHLEHEIGSGWSPEGEALLRRRIAERGITWLDASTVYIWAAYMKWLGRPMIFNRSNWGLADSTLPETIQRAASRTASR
jgi:hypothetical protein